MFTSRHNFFLFLLALITWSVWHVYVWDLATWIANDSSSYLEVGTAVLTGFESPASLFSFAVRPWLVSVLMSLGELASIGTYVQLALWVSSAVLIREILLLQKLAQQSATSFAGLYLLLLGPLALTGVLLSETWAIFFVLLSLYGYLKHHFSLSMIAAACAALTRPNLIVLWCLLLFVLVLRKHFVMASKALVLSSALLMSQSILAAYFLGTPNWVLLSSRIHSYKYLFAFLEHVESSKALDEILVERSQLADEKINSGNMQGFNQLYQSDLERYSWRTWREALKRIALHNTMQGSNFIKDTTLYFVSLAQNVLLMFALLYCSMKFCLRTKLTFDTLTTFESLILLLSFAITVSAQVSFFQGDRLTLIVQPLILILCGLSFANKNMSRSESP